MNNPDFPQVKCSSCDAVGKWNRFEQVKEWVNAQMYKWEEADCWYWAHTCPSCVAKRDRCTLQEAQLTCHKSRYGYDNKVERSNADKMAKLHAIDEFSSYTGKEIRNIVRASLLVVLKPLAKYIIRKTRVLEKQ